MNLKIDFTPNLISNSLAQITAEERKNLTASSEAAVMDGLNALNNAKWQLHSNLQFIDTNKISIKPEPIQLINSSQVSIKKTIISIKADKQVIGSDIFLVPVFHAIIRPIIHNLADQIAIRTGGYLWDLVYTKYGQKAEIRFPFQTPKLNTKDITALVKYELDKEIINHTISTFRRDSTVLLDSVNEKRFSRRLACI